MKRVFRFKKGETYDGDTALDNFFAEYLIEPERDKHGNWVTTNWNIMRKNWKVTVIIEEENRHD